MAELMTTTATPATIGDGDGEQDRDDPKREQREPPTSTSTSKSSDGNCNNNNEGGSFGTSSSTSTNKCLSTLVSYPDLIRHEEALAASPHDVTAWMAYLSDVDSYLETLRERREESSERSSHSHSHTPTSTSTSETVSTTDGRKSKRQQYQQQQQQQQTKTKTKRFKPFRLGGRDVPTASMLPSLISDLTRARVSVGERALSLLPGSYKLWKTHLEFRTSLLTLRGASYSSPEAAAAEEEYEYEITSSHRRRRYRAAVSAFERALVRMNKMPRIWIMYLNFLVKYSDSVTTIRRSYDRALLALPATQHERVVWPSYLKWARGSLESNTADKGSDGDQHGDTGSANDGRRRSSSAKADYSTGRMYIPHETTLRILRRYANSFNPTYRESLARLCLDPTLGRYGEGASLLVDVLNDVDFVSPLGSTRHDLWVVLSDACCKHPEDVVRAGVDFDRIVRAALASSERPQATHQPTFERRATTTPLPSTEGEAASQEEAQTTAPQQPLQFGEIEGTLYVKLADFYTRLGEFEMARSVYEEALEAVSRVRDFTLVFDAYGRFEEANVSAQVALLEEEEEEEEEEEGMRGDGKATADDADRDEGEDEDKSDLHILLGDDEDADVGGVVGGGAGSSSSSTTAAIELELARAEHLMERRPLLLNRVLLRQNPHNVGEWLRRSDLYLKLGTDNGVKEAIGALEEGVRSANARRAVNGNPAQLWIKLAKIHEVDCEDVDAARHVFERVCLRGAYRFKDVDDSAQVWAAWVEMELRVEEYDAALSVARQAVATPSDYGHRGQQRAGGNKNKGGKVQTGLHRSLRLWNLALDLEESLGGIDNAKAAYARCVELGVATPQIVLNYATFLSENKYFEESFGAYEKGLGLFPFPHPGATRLWKAYLKAFQDRYGGTKMERTRELFERCVEDCPADGASEFYLEYAKFEEAHGLAKRALGAYERLCRAVPPEERLKAYQLYVAKAESSVGASKTRPIYEAAIAALEDRDAAAMCLQYADLETRLGEVDRARAALVYGAQMADPRRDPEYWKRWHAFEVSRGNEESFREMLRVKRGVAAAFSTVNYNAAEMGAAEPAGRPKNLTEDEALEMIAKREGVKHKNLPTIGGFVSGSKRTATEANLEDLERQAARLRQATAAGGKEEGVDAGEIDIEDDEEVGESGGRVQTDDAQVEAVQDVRTKAVPEAVLGGLGKEAHGDGSNMGALERLKAAAKKTGS